MARKIHERFTYNGFDVQTPEGKVRCVQFTDSETKEVDEYIFPLDDALKFGTMLQGATLIEKAPASALDSIKGAMPPPGARRRR